jgi:hypothetical protein
MRMFRLLLAALCIVSLALAGCSKSSSSGSGGAQLRILNAFSEAPAINVTVASTTVASGLPFQGLTQYTNIDSGTPMFTVGVTGASTTLINTTYTVGNASYTYIVFGPLTGVGAILGNDAFNDPGNGFFSVRIVNAAPGSSAVDVYLTAPGADISSSAPSLGNISYGVTSTFVPIAIGASFEIRVTPTGTKEVIFDSTPKTFPEHSGTDIVVFGKGSGKLVNVALLTHDSAGTGSIVENLLAQYKVINASLVPSAINVFVDATLQLSNIPYTGVSNYQKTTAGAHNFSIEATSTPGASLLSLARTLAAATDTSIALSGTAGALTALVLTDDNLPPPTGTAGVRVVNVSGAATPFDVFVNFSKQVSSLVVNSASPYLNFNAAANTGTAYEFDFNAAGTTTAILKMTGVVLTSGHKYTIYVAGPSRVSSLRISDPCVDCRRRRLSDGSGVVRR